MKSACYTVSLFFIPPQPGLAGVAGADRASLKSGTCLVKQTNFPRH